MEVWKNEHTLAILLMFNHKGEAKMKKALLAVTLVMFSGAALAHNWFPEGQRITTYTGAGVAYVTPLTTNRSFSDKAACEAFLTEQRLLNSFRDGNGKNMTSVVVAACHQAPIVNKVEPHL